MSSSKDRTVKLDGNGNTYTFNFDAMTISMSGFHVSWPMRVEDNMLQYYDDGINADRWIELHPMVQDAYRSYLIDKILLEDDE